MAPAPCGPACRVSGKTAACAPLVAAAVERCNVAGRTTPLLPAVVVLALVGSLLGWAVRPIALRLGVPEYQVTILKTSQTLGGHL